MAPPPKINPVATTTPTPTQLSQSSELSLIDPMIMIEFYTALSRGALQIIATNLNLSKEKQEVLLSLGENASRIGFIATNEDINSGTYVAIFSGLAIAVKALDLGLKSIKGKYFQEIVQEHIGKFSKKAIGEEMTNKIGNAIGKTPEQLKKFTSQLLFVFALYSLSEVLKNLENKENKIQPPKLEERMLIGFLASACSALTGAIINLGVDKFFSRFQRSDSALSVDAEASGGVDANSTQGGGNIAGGANQPIEISARLGIVSSTTPAPAPQSPSMPSMPSIQRRE